MSLEELRKLTELLNTRDRQRCERLHKILVIEDDSSWARFLNTVLSSTGYEVTICDHGKIALDQLDGCPFGLAIIDLKLPDINGLDLLERMKELCPTMVCVILTAFSNQKTAIDAVNLGAVGYMEKAGDKVILPDLVKVLHRVIGEDNGRK